MPSHANRWMLRDVLRGEWKFDGVIVSDWNAIRELTNRHHLATDLAHAARLAVDATVDIELPDIETYQTLVGQVKRGVVPMAPSTRLSGVCCTPSSRSACSRTRSSIPTRPITCRAPKCIGPAHSKRRGSR